MKQEGLDAFALRKEHRSGVYSHENETSILCEEFERQFKKNKSASNFFKEQPPSYRKVMIHWIMSAKQEKTRIARLEKTIAFSHDGKRVL